MRPNRNASFLFAVSLCSALFVGPPAEAAGLTPVTQFRNHHCPSETNAVVPITPGPNTRYLNSFEAVSGDGYAGSADLEGMSYPESLILDVWTADAATSQYNLSREWATFKAVVGVSDQAPSGARVRFELFGDGQRLYCKDLEVGQADMLDADVGDVLRLEIKETLLSDSLSGMENDRAMGVWGDAIVENEE